MNTSLEIPTNQEVTWDGTRFGLLPKLSKKADALLTGGDQFIPALLEALENADRFVVAHVLLTKISGVRYETSPSWNGLEVHLSADGAARIDPTQRFHLAERWRLWYRTEPRPEALPE